MNLPLVSVVIPLYNKAPYISKCIWSILDQSISDFEVIVIDDGSTDKGETIVENIMDPRVRLITQNNLGVSTARNRGVEEAKFNYVAFLDADDWWHRDFLHEMLKIIQKYPNAGLYACNYEFIKSGNVVKSSLQMGEVFEDGYIDYLNLFYQNDGISPICASAVVVDKCKFEKLEGFNPSLKYGEDLYFWLKMAVNYKIAYLNKPLAYYNYDVDPNNRAISNKMPLKANFFIFNLEYFYPFEILNKDLKKMLDLLRLKYLKPYYLSGKYGDDVKRILAEIKYYPLKFRFFYSMPQSWVKLLYEKFS